MFVLRGVCNEMVLKWFRVDFLKHCKLYKGPLIGYNFTHISMCVLEIGNLNLMCLGSGCTLYATHGGDTLCECKCDECLKEYYYAERWNGINKYNHALVRKERPSFSNKL